ncbi:MAG: GMC family oxidoreductase [Dehalococcoidia bacterium]
MSALETEFRGAQMKRHKGRVDACIIGCGAAGSVLAKELAEAGWRVVVLEAGPWLDTDRDLRQDEVEMLGKFDWDDRRWVDGNEPFAQGHIRDGRGVGGGTLHYGAVALRLWPEDFERFTRDGVGRDWPISYDELAPDYDRVERELRLSGPLEMPWGPRRDKYPQGPHPLTARDMMIASGMDRRGMAWTNTPLGILQGGHEGRSPCMNYGYCQWGCKSRAKASMHVTYVPKAVRAGAEIRDRARVTSIEAGADGRIEAVICQRAGREERIEASVVILSAFCVENPRLLLHSATPAFPDGLANSSGMVGRGIMAHIADPMFGRFAEPVHMWSTSPGTLLSQHHYGTQAARTNGGRNGSNGHNGGNGGNGGATGGRGTPSFAGGWSWMTSVLFPGEFGGALAKAAPSLWGERLTTLLGQYPYFAILGDEGECLWYEDNRVELTDEVDEFGIPRPKITFNFGENERAMRDEIHLRGREILAAAGAHEILIANGNDHTMGGCVMGDDPATSVVDRNLRAHDHDNLYICDASVFPSSGGAQPSQTIMALATRLARHLASGEAD